MKTSASAGGKAPRPGFPEDIAELPVIPSLPDPFSFFDPRLGTNGRVATKTDWEARREEIKDLAMYYFYGYKQPTLGQASRLISRDTEVPETVLIDRRKVMEAGSFGVKLPEGSYIWDFSDFSLHPVLDYRDEAWGCWENHRDLLLTVPAHIRSDILVAVADVGKTAEFKLDALETPVEGIDTEYSPPYPVLIVIGGLPAEQVRTLKKCGYACICMNTGTVYSDSPSRGGAYTELYPYSPGLYEYDSGALMGWAWGVSRIIDALANDPSFGIDAGRTAVTGVSRNGKAALLAAAFDDRVSVAIPCDSGAAGLTGFRVFNEGRLYGYNVFNEHCQMNRVFSRNEKPINTISGSGHWLCSKASAFLPDKNERFPFDMHEIAALVAPRPLLAFSGENFEWVNSVSTAVTVDAVREVYEFLGAGGNIALIVRDGAHANQDRDLPFIIAVMDKTFGRSAELTAKRHIELMNSDDFRALDGSGVIYPEKTFPSIFAMSAVPYELDSAYRRWSRPGKYFIWTDAELVTEGFPFEIAAYTDAPEARLTLPDCTALSEKAADGKAVFKLSSEMTKPGRYRLETAGSDKENMTVYFQGQTLSDALRHGLNLYSTSPDGMSVGFSGRLAEKEGIEAFITTADGKTEKLETGTIDGAAPVYLERYGVSLKKQAICEGPFVFSLKNVRLEPLPGFTLELHLELTGVMQPNPFAGGALEGRAQSKQGEKPTWPSSCLKRGPMPEWPIYPASAADDGSRPEHIPSQSAFSVEVELAERAPDRILFRFGAPVNPREFGIGFEGISSWRLEWAEDASSVEVVFNEAVPEGRKAVIFRLADIDGNMLPSPVALCL